MPAAPAAGCFCVRNGLLSVSKGGIGTGRSKPCPGTKRQCFGALHRVEIQNHVILGETAFVVAEVRVYDAASEERQKKTFLEPRAGVQILES